MDFHDAHLRERDDGLDVVGDEVFADLRLLLNLHPAERVRPPLLGVFQIHAGRGDACRAVHQRQRTTLDVRHDPVGDALVIPRELDLGDSLIGIDQAVWVRDVDARDCRRDDDGAVLRGMSACRIKNSFQCSPSSPESTALTGRR